MIAATSKVTYFGAASCLTFAVIVAIDALLYFNLIAAPQGHSAPAAVGYMFAMLASLPLGGLGVFLAVLAFERRERHRVVSWAGLLLNIAVLSFFIVLYLR